LNAYFLGGTDTEIAENCFDEQAAVSAGHRLAGKLRALGADKLLGDGEIRPMSYGSAETAGSFNRT